MGRIDSFEDLGCLVTGASSGIGRDIARLLAAQGARLAISARRGERLETLAGELKDGGAPEAHVLVADLAQQGAPAALARDATARLGQVDVLVNNAGFGVAGQFAGCDLDRTLAMLQVNVAAAVELARLLLPGMIQRGRGGVLNVASMAGYQAAPYQSAYAGTKAFLLNWSDGLHQEVKHTDVAVTALCPGVTDTEFFEVAGYRRLTGFLKHRMPSMKAAAVGVRALRRGKMEAVPGFLNKTAIFLQRFLSRRLVASVSRRLLGGRSHSKRRPPSAD